MSAAVQEVTAPSPGLSSGEAQRRLAELGPNEIHREKATSPWAILASQFKGAMIWLLLGACVVSAALGEVIDAIAIGAIVVLNSLVGFFQEYRAERAVQALRSMTAPRARVLRDGASVMIPATEVVVSRTLAPHPWVGVGTTCVVGSSLRVRRSGRRRQRGRCRLWKKWLLPAWSLRITMPLWRACFLCFSGDSAMRWIWTSCASALRSETKARRSAFFSS